jgi:hypothetical protein
VPDNVNNVGKTTQHDIIDLYLVDDMKLESRTSDKPFLHNISIADEEDQTLEVTALFDQGAIIGGWQPTSKILRMANGTLIPSKAK